MHHVYNNSTRKVARALRERREGRTRKRQTERKCSSLCKGMSENNIKVELVPVLHSVSSAVFCSTSTSSPLLHSSLLAGQWLPYHYPSLRFHDSIHSSHLSHALFDFFCHFYSTFSRCTFPLSLASIHPDSQVLVITSFSHLFHC